MIALTRDVSPSIVGCELTHLSRAPIDVEKACQQHREYERALEDAGCTIVRVPPAPDLPDAVFIEDMAIVLDHVAIVTRPGAESRRAEVGDVSATLTRYRRVVAFDAPGTLDGGDVLVMGRQIFVGRSTRSNDAGIDQLRTFAAPGGYAVDAVDVRHCLHLKSGVTALNDETVLVNPAWVAAERFASLDIVAIDPHEPAAANALRIAGTVIYPLSFPRTLDRLLARGLAVTSIDVSELQKAEGAVTCCSIVFR